MHDILHRNTDRGQRTRSLLLRHIHPNEEVSRDELVNRSGLTYDQVRRQTKNLCIEGILQSRIENGQRRYSLRQSFISKSVVSA
ncbi:MAG TPA: hypothetical protein ACFE0H_12715 [Elainellaceae cyanobacterium]